MIDYVIHDGAGNLTGSNCADEVAEAHAEIAILCTEEQRRTWLMYRGVQVERQIGEIITPPPEDAPEGTEPTVEPVIGMVWELELLPEPEPDLVAIRARKWEAIKAERDRRKAGGVLASGKWFHTDSDSRIQQLGLVMMGASVPAVPWKTLDGSFIAMSEALAGEIFAAVAALDIAAFGAAETHRAAMEAAEDPAAYDFSTGWPTVYGEAP